MPHVISSAVISSVVRPLNPILLHVEYGRPSLPVALSCIFLRRYSKVFMDSLPIFGLGTSLARSVRKHFIIRSLVSLSQVPFGRPRHRSVCRPIAVSVPCMPWPEGRLPKVGPQNLCSTLRSSSVPLGKHCPGFFGVPALIPKQISCGFIFLHSAQYLLHTLRLYKAFSACDKG